MSAEIAKQIPDHVPHALVLESNPWHGGAVPPHEWLRRVVGQGGGLRYSRKSPLATQEDRCCWIAVGAKEIRSILIDHRNFISKDSTGVGNLIGEDLVLAPLEADAPDHQRLRGILQPHFQPKAVKQRQERIRTLAMALIGRLSSVDRCEFIRDFAVQLPTQIFLEIVGLPVEDLPQFLEWEDIAMGRKTPEKAAETWLAIKDYLGRALEQRRQSPTDDLLGQIAARTAEMRQNPDAEALGMAMILFVAGLDTVVTALGWHFKYLAEHPEDQERLRRDPSLIPAAVDEMLRAFSFTTLTRTAVRDTEISGVTVKAGDMVVCPSPLGSRDPADFAEPERVDFDRGSIRHLGFGFGQHICIGMHLARLELITAIECWLEAMPQFRLPHGYQPSSHGGISFGLNELELEW